MSILASNQLPIIPDYDSRGYLRWNGNGPCVKIDVEVEINDAIMQVSEDPNGVFENDVSQEILLRVGQHSKVFATGITAVRFRVWEKSTVTPGTPGAIANIVLYG